MYRSEYVNCTLAGITADGAPFAFVAGKHQQDFPYDAPESKWDSVLLLVGDEAFAIHGRELSGLAFDLDLRAGEGLARIRFEGPLRTRDGRAAHGHLQLTAAFRRFPPFALGKPSAAPWLPGLVWTPVRLDAAPGAASRVQLGETARPLAAWCGQLEHGAFANLSCRRLAIAYDYLSLASAAYAHVAFATYPLDGDGLTGRALRWYLARTAAEELTLEAGELRRGNPRGARRDVDVVLTDTVDLGPAELDRQLVSSSDAAGARLFGLREVFRRK